VTDDQRWDALGCAGNPVILTPNMDLLAGRGVRFANAFATTPICAASRASILTGLYERAHGYTFERPPLSREFVAASYPLLLRRTGYRTGFVGKLGVQLNEGDAAAMFDFFQPSAQPYFKTVAGTRRHLTDINTDRAVEFLQGCTPGRPFCLSLSYWAPHAEDSEPEQYFWPESCDGLYADAPLEPPGSAARALFEAQPAFLRENLNRVRWHWRFDTPEKYRRMVKGYYRMISAVDAGLGRLLEALERLDLDQNTVVIVTSDNGYFLGERGYAGKWTMHEPSIRVPLIICDQRGPAGGGAVLEEMVLNVDLAPTVLDLAGIEPPETMQGRSLLPLVRGEAAVRRSEIFTEHLWEHPRIPRTEAVRTESWKYIRYPQHPEFEELYGLADDPGEERNLAGLPDFGSRLFEMRSRCERLAASLYPK
jgi:arylsulfatase A-like enzyme